MTTIPFANQEHIEGALLPAVEHLRAGRVLAHPTETVYGLGCRLESHALACIARLKRRTPQKPFVVLVDGARMLAALGTSMSSSADALAKRFWPGPLTLVLPTSHREIPDAVRSDAGVAVRWTSHQGLLRLLGAIGEPMTSTSANVSTLPPARSAEEIAHWWPDETASGELLVLDGGPLRDQLPSTVVDCSSDTPRVLRAGVIPVHLLRDTVPRLVGEA